MDIPTLVKKAGKDYERQVKKATHKMKKVKDIHHMSKLEQSAQVIEKKYSELIDSLELPCPEKSNAKNAVKARLLSIDQAYFGIRTSSVWMYNFINGNSRWKGLTS